MVHANGVVLRAFEPSLISFSPEALPCTDITRRLDHSRTRIFFFAGRRLQYAFELSHAPSQFPFETFGHDWIGDDRQCLRTARRQSRSFGGTPVVLTAAEGDPFVLRDFDAIVETRLNRFERESENNGDRSSKRGGQTNPWKCSQMSVYVIERIDSNRTIEARGT